MAADLKELHQRAEIAANAAESLFGPALDLLVRHILLDQGQKGDFHRLLLSQIHRDVTHDTPPI